MFAKWLRWRLGVSPGSDTKTGTAEGCVAKARGSAEKTDSRETKASLGPSFPNQDASI